MPGRIRNIKPELRELAEFAGLTDGAARLFTMLYTLADDGGCCPAGASFLAGAVFFARPRTPASIGRLLSELEEARLIRRHTVSGSPFVSIVGWLDKGHPNYQFIKKPVPFRYCAVIENQSTPERPPERPPQTPPSDSDSDDDSDERVGARPTGTIPPPQTVPSQAPGEIAYDPNQPEDRGRLAYRTWAELDAARQRVHHRLGRSAPFPLPVITPANETRGFRDLRERIREEGAIAPIVCAAILHHLEVQAFDTSDTQWLSEKAFTEGAWRTARNALEEPTRAGPRSVDLRVVREEDDEPDFGMGMGIATARRPA